MTTLYLVRHGQSEGNDEGRIQGSTDRPLSVLGRQQLEPLALRCKDMEAVHVYTSPLKRAYETALAVNRYKQLPLTQRADLQEMFVGEWENQRVDYIAERWPEERRVWSEEHHRFAAPGGETTAQVYARASAAIKEIAARHQGQSVFVVSHGCVIRNLSAWALGGPEYADSQQWVTNTSITRIDVDDQGRPSLVSYGDDGHLSGGPVAPKDKA